MDDAKAPIPQFERVDRSDLYERLVGSLFDAVYLVDQQRCIAHWNKAAEELTGFTPGEVRGRCCADNILMHVDGHGTLLCTNGCPLQKTLEDGQSRETLIYFRHKLGHRVPVTVRTQPVVDSTGKIVAALEIFRDARQSKEFQRRISELERLAYLDPLTHIPNRRYTEQQLKRFLGEKNFIAGEVGVVMFDVDHFKQVNDVFGHAAGDAVLQALTKTLFGALRDSDMVGRWGGEEFLAVLPNLREGILQDLAERCRTLIANAGVPWQGMTLQVTASAGATCIRAEDNLSSLLARVDTLLYQSKVGGRNRVTMG